MVKILTAMPGDAVEVNEWQIIINGKPVGEGLPLAKELHLPEQHFYGKSVLEDGHYWFMGRSPLSFDSRYWGAVEDEQIIGRAYPLI
jgi:conjugal transfer pilin signal peptidase TrbI